MSNRSAAQPPSRQSTTGNDVPGRLETVDAQRNQYGQRSSTGSSITLPPTPQRQQALPTSGFELPPLPRGPVSAHFSPSSSRLAGVASILNPPSVEESTSARRRKVSELESPTGAPSLPPLSISTQASPVPSRVGRASPATSYAGPAERQIRRILTPRSPSLHRAASLTQLNVTTGTISAQQTPFPGSPRGRPYTIEPGISGAPPLPSAPAAIYHDYGYGAPSTAPPPEMVTGASSGPVRGPRIASASVSPTTSYSSYSQAEQTSPAAQYSAGPASLQYSASNDMSSSNVGEDRQRPLGIPISSSGGQNVYQMMTLETTSGTVQLPVDVQAASRVADEKRRRNAGASARFRQRRKEKEREASTTISRLEQQVKELNDDVDYYKRERDYFATVVLQIPGGDRHFPRPSSPRRRRSSAAIPGPSGTTYGAPQESAPQSPEHGRNVRRRTSTLSLPPPPPPSALSGQPPHFQTGYGQQAFVPSLAPQQMQPLQPAPGPLPSPSSRAPLPLPQQGPPQLMQAPPQTGPWNPYAADRRPPGPPYDER